jgi:hypothetical protein
VAGSWWSRAAASPTQNLKEVGPGDGQLRRDLTGRFGSASAGQAVDLTAGKLPLKLSGRIADIRGGRRSGTAHSGRGRPAARSGQALCNLINNTSDAFARPNFYVDSGSYLSDRYAYVGGNFLYDCAARRVPERAPLALAALALAVLGWVGRRSPAR